MEFSGTDHGCDHDSAAATYDRYQELKTFDESKAGVKGLVDSGISKVPRMFIRPKHEIDEDNNPTQPVHDFTVPVIDFHGIGSSQLNRKKVVSQVMAAASEVGFFQVVNHGIATSVLDEMLSAARAFHELPREEKEGYYAREQETVNYGSNFDLYQSKYANWRDTLFCAMEPNPPQPQHLPPVCRDITLEYTKKIKALGVTVFELLSEALGLDPDYLKNMECAKGQLILSHYYPACPEPELTLGTSSHSDPDFLTILVQDNLGGLQVRYQNHRWIDVPHVPGAVIVNIGDLLQLMSNDVFKSVEHRVLANSVGPRISIACFFTCIKFDLSRKYGPIKELISESNPAVYMEITMGDYISTYSAKGLDGQSSLTKFKLQSV